MASSNKKPGFQAKITADPVYVGECPQVEIIVTAPMNCPVPIIRRERVFDRQVLRLDIHSSDGSRIPGGPGHVHRVRKPDDFLQLESGESIVMQFAAWGEPPKPGNYVVRLKFSPTPDESLVFERELPVRCIDIPEKGVVDKVIIGTPPNFHHDNPMAQKAVVQFMNLKTNRGHELCYRVTWDKEVGFASRFFRLHALDENSRIIAVPKYFDQGGFMQQFWLTFNKGAHLHFARILFPIGACVENRIIQPSKNGVLLIKPR